MNHSIEAKLIYSSQICGQEVSQFIEYVLHVDPELDRSEATMVGAIILHHLPSAFADTPQMLDELKKTCKLIKQRRK